MALDVYNLSSKDLYQLNTSLLKYKQNSLLKLHNLQRVNHNLIIENTKLKQTLKYGSKESESLLLGFKNLKGLNLFKSIQVNVDTHEDHTATLYFKCLLSPSEMSDYFSCDFSDLQYKVILVEFCDNFVENASTVVTKQSQLKLKMLQTNIKYLVTVHLFGNGKKLSGETQFVYNKKPSKSPEDSLKMKNVDSELKVKEEKPKTNDSSRTVYDERKEYNTQLTKKGECNETELNTSFREYSLNVQIDEDYYITCKFSEDDQVEKVVENFMKVNKIKDFLKDSLIRCVTELKSSGDSIKTVDLSDLVPV